MHATLAAYIWVTPLLLHQRTVYRTQCIQFHLEKSPRATQEPDGTKYKYNIYMEMNWRQWKIYRKSYTCVAFKRMAPEGNSEATRWWHMSASSVLLKQMAKNSPWCGPNTGWATMIITTAAADIALWYYEAIYECESRSAFHTAANLYVGIPREAAARRKGKRLEGGK